MTTIIHSLSHYFTSQEKQREYYAAVIYQLCAAFMYAFCSIFVKSFTLYEPVQILMYRSLLQIITVTVIIQQMGIKSYLNKNKQIQTFVIFRGIIGFVSAICLFYGLTKLPLSISLLLFNTIPLWTFTAATLILRIQKFDFKTLAIFLFALFGIILIVDPPINIISDSTQIKQSSTTNLLAALIVLLGAIGMSFAEVTINLLSKKVYLNYFFYFQGINSFVLMQYLSLCGIIISSFYLIQCSPQILTPTFHESFQILCYGFTYFIAQACMNRAYVIGDVTLVSLIGLSQVIFGLFFDVILFDYSLNKQEMIGSFIVLTALYLVIRMRNKELKQ